MTNSQFSNYPNQFSNLNSNINMFPNQSVQLNNQFNPLNQTQPITKGIPNQSDLYSYNNYPKPK